MSWHQTRRRPRPVRVLAGLLAVAVAASTIALAGCSASAGTKSELRIGSSQPIQTLNPFLFQGAAAFVALTYVYPRLVFITPSLQPQPGLATAWQESPDGLTWTFDIRPGLKWSDGRPLGAADVAWTINTVLQYRNGATASMADALANVTDATAPSATTLVVHLQHRVAPMLAQLSLLFILPRQVWGKVATGNGSGITRFANPAPLVSGGPFVLTTFRQNDVVLFKRNTDWWGTQPQVDEFGIQLFGSDDALVQALKGGQIDAAMQIPPTSVSALRADKQIQVFDNPGIWFDELGINSNVHKTHDRELLDPRVREALSLAIDRQSIVRTTWLGFAQPGSSILAPAQAAFRDPSIEPDSFSIQRASQILDQAGYRRGPDGIRRADGHEMSYTVIFPAEENGASDRSFQIIQSDFQQIGVRVAEQKLDNTAAINAITAPNGNELTADLYLWGWSNRPDPGFILSVFTCSNIGNLNDSAYCNPSYDKLYAEQLSAPTVAQRQQILYQMQQMLFTARPYLVLEYRDFLDAASRCWSGLQGSPQGAFNTLTIDTILTIHRVC